VPARRCAGTSDAAPSGHAIAKATVRPRSSDSYSEYFRRRASEASEERSDNASVAWRSVTVPIAADSPRLRVRPTALRLASLAQGEAVKPSRRGGPRCRSHVRSLPTAARRAEPSASAPLRWRERRRAVGPRHREINCATAAASSEQRFPPARRLRFRFRLRLRGPPEKSERLHRSERGAQRQCERRLAQRHRSDCRGFSAPARSTVSPSTRFARSG